MSYFPSTYPVIHIARKYGGTDPDTGNLLLHTEPPMVRYVQEVVIKASQDVLDSSGEFANRVEETVKMCVDDPSVYKTEDQVIITPTLRTDGTWITGTGVAFWVDGIPQDDRQGPWASLFAQFGGIIMLKRVT